MPHQPNNAANDDSHKNKSKDKSKSKSKGKNKNKCEQKQQQHQPFPKIDMNFEPVPEPPSEPLVQYSKRTNKALMKQFEETSSVQLFQAQNYIPIYDKLFALNETNFSVMNLDGGKCITKIHNEYSDSYNLTHSIMLCDIAQKNFFNEQITTSMQPVFFKYTPLFEPYKYLIGQYSAVKPDIITQLPLPSYCTVDSTISPQQQQLHEKITDPNNASYVDSFFVYLTHQLLHKHHFAHGITYYGSYIGMKKNLQVNVYDDFDVIVTSRFFHKNKGKIFTIEPYDHLTCMEGEVITGGNAGGAYVGNEIQRPIAIKILNTCDDNVPLEFDSLDEVENEVKDVKEVKAEDEEIVQQATLEEVEQIDDGLIDMAEDNFEDDDTDSASEHTGDVSEGEEGGEGDDMDDYDDCDDCEGEANVGEGEQDNTVWEDCEGEYGSEGDDEDDDDEHLYVTFPEFPVQLTCMELFKDTFENFSCDYELSDEEWYSALMQIIFILLTYQKLFSFTHNDLHMDNIMYIETTDKYLYYTYAGIHYRVPTFGRIYKIIDFGRSIYTYHGKIYCSDSFKTTKRCDLIGDAASQYNTEPYYSPSEKRIDPNYSFDLCRLACSLLTHFIESTSDLEPEQLKHKSPLVRLIADWCTDDSGKNILFRRDGKDRYPGFKLYKMIARRVHAHTPERQLGRPMFRAFKVSLLPKIISSGYYMNIDELIRKVH